MPSYPENRSNPNPAVRPGHKRQEQADETKSARSVPTTQRNSFTQVSAREIREPEPQPEES